jgi:hypothetical protein
LPASRQPGDTGGGVDGVTRKILSPFLCRAKVKSNLDGEPKIIPAWQRVDRELHAASSLACQLLGIPT